MQERVNATLYFTYASSHNHYENSQNKNISCVKRKVIEYVKICD
jgi:hypothetical protein